ncbi:hypothetical protein Eta_0038 [Serratia phage Eta]|uniref:Uncharacterized protein n=1 Tax=Serratia phage Eta TaxID=1282995 RepID=R9W0Y8_9CAUD|nr:hypothetical protein Eta_0038 [Serratia phage Eta]AGN89484.1 hypothetical protein Eta_0038 [Serratia phage Eta]
MKLGSDDLSTIAEYIRGESPFIRGPIFIDFNKLDEAFMDTSKLIAMTAILKMKYSLTKPSK